MKFPLSNLSRLMRRDRARAHQRAEFADHLRKPHLARDIGLAPRGLEELRPNPRMPL